MSEIASYCDICKSYHPPRPASACRTRALRREQRGERKPGSTIGVAIALGLMLGWGVGALTEDGVIAIGTAVGVAVVIIGVGWVRSR